MSGGSWEYVYLRFEDVAQRLSDSKSLRRKMLGSHIWKLAELMHTIEWNDSCDTNEDETPLIDNLLKYNVIDDVVSKRLNEISAELEEIKLFIKDKK